MAQSQKITVHKMGLNVLNKFKRWLNGAGAETDFRPNDTGERVFHDAKVYAVPADLVGLERVTTALVKKATGVQPAPRLPSDPVQRAKLEALRRDLEAANA